MNNQTRDVAMSEPAKAEHKKETQHFNLADHQRIQELEEKLNLAELSAH